MKFRVLLTRPAPPAAVEQAAKQGITLPPDATVDEQYNIEAKDREAVVAMFEKMQASGLTHLQGRTIKSIEAVHNGKTQA